MSRDAVYLRLDTLERVHPDSIAWGAPVDVKVRRAALFKERGPGRVPYMPVSALWAVRLVPASPLEERAARIAFLVVRDGKDCLYCGARLNLETCQVEHIVPVSCGGPDHAANLALACPGCNAAAGNLPVAEKIRLAARLQVGTLIAEAAAGRGAREVGR